MKLERSQNLHLKLQIVNSSAEIDGIRTDTADKEVVVLLGRLLRVTPNLIKKKISTFRK